MSLFSPGVWLRFFCVGIIGCLSRWLLLVAKIRLSGPQHLWLPPADKDQSKEQLKMVKARKRRTPQTLHQWDNPRIQEVKIKQYPNTSLVQVKGMNTGEEVDWHRGKRSGYIYKAKMKKNVS